MSSLTPFSFESHEVRFLPEGDSFSVVAKDVLQSLGYATTTLSNIGDAIRHVPDEWKGRVSIPTLGGQQDMLTLTEQGFYLFINRSDKPKALPFQKWIAGEVLPAIRKTGSYAPAETQPSTDALAAQLATCLKGKVIVDYDSLCRLARMTRAGLDKIAEGERLLADAEQVGLELEQQCGKPLVRFDIPADRRERHRATPNAAHARRFDDIAPADPWDGRVQAYIGTRSEVSITSILQHLGIEPAQQTQTHKNRIAGLLRYLGFSVVTVRRGGRTQRVYQRVLHA